ncbi:hypothetical protein [Ktedonospora formicarum]|nr:hypothetical protein [Ktedonospora formicarum]
MRFGALHPLVIAALMVGAAQARRVLLVPIVNANTAGYNPA